MNFSRAIRILTKSSTQKALLLRLNSIKLILLSVLVSCFITERSAAESHWHSAAGSDYEILLDLDEELPVGTQQDTLVNMCDIDTTTAPTGTFYDSGGPNSDYSDSENCSLLISPECAGSVSLVFESFGTEACCDYLRVYDGANTSAPQILYAIGSSVPDTVTGESGQLYITFNSDYSINSSGWVASWTSVIVDDNPVADFFIVSNSNPPLNTSVEFTDESSTFVDQWQWDFGDGNNSIEQNPTHSYSEPGVYDVTLISINCFGADTTSQQIQVQSAPELFIDPTDTLHLSASCGASPEGSFTIYNNGLGDLALSTSNSLVSSNGIKMLGLIPTYDFNGQYSNTLDAINENFTDYELFESQPSSAAELSSDLENIDLLLIPEPSGPTSLFSSIGPALFEFLEEGGNILICGTSSLGNTGLLDGGIIVSSISGLTLNTNPLHPIMTGVPDEFNASPFSYYYNWETEPDAEVLAVYENTPELALVATKDYGQGTLVYAGFDFYNVTETNTQIIGNAMEFLSGKIQPSWLNNMNFSTPSTIAPGDSIVVDVQFDANELAAGDYYFDLPLITNDTTSSNFPLVLHFTITGEAALSVDTNEINFSPLIAGFTEQDTVVVSNPGCDTLNIEAFLDNPAFSVQPQNLTIPEYSEDTLIVTFAPLAPGIQMTQLELESNGGNQTIEISGEALPAPEISINPQDTLHTIVSCGTVLEDSITIYNSGSGQLELSISGFDDQFEPVEVLALKTYSDYNNEYDNTLEALEVNFSNYNITESLASSSEDLEADLEGIDILLIPRQQYYMTELYQGISDALVNFANAGGSILICGNTRMEYTGLFNNMEYTGHSPDSLLNLDPSHPVLSSVPESFIDGNVLYYDWSEDIYLNPLVSHLENNNDYAVAVKSFGTGTVVYCGFTYDSWEDFISTGVKSQILGNAMAYLAGSFCPQWLENIPLDSSLNISPGDSLTLPLQFDAELLYPGDYYYDVVFETNDPQNVFVPYVFHMEVEGIASLSTNEDEVTFEPVTAQFSVGEEVIVYNSGCDTMYVSANTSDPSFISEAELVMEPYSQDTLSITFSPETPGSYSAQLELTSNGGDKNINLLGEALEIPEVSISPADTLHTIVECPTTTEASFTMYNNGPGNLTINPEVQIVNEFDTANVLILMTNTSDSRYQNIVSAINENFTAYNLFESEATTSEELTADLENIDVLIVPYQSSSYYLFTDLSEALTGYADSGGNIFFCGTRYAPRTGLFESGHLGEYVYSTTLINLNSNHPVMSGVPETFTSSETTYHYFWQSEDNMEVLAVQEESEIYCMAAEKTYGEGKIIYSAYIFSTVNEYGAQIIGNAIEYLAEGSQPDWLEDIALDTTNTISPGDSLVVEVQLNSDELIAGDYYYNIPFTSNDPDNDSLNYVFHLEVVGDAAIALSENQVNFDPMMAELTATDTVIVSNEGCQPLTIAAEWSLDEYAVVPEDLTISPYSQDTLVITFQPLEAGIFPDQLELVTNVGDSVINLNGEALPAPDINFSPYELSMDIPPCADSILISVGLENLGEGNLEYELQNHLLLPAVLEELDLHYPDIRNLVPGIHNFTGGISGTSIYDGGDDMYSFGNKLNTNFAQSIPYSTSNIIADGNFGEGGHYFTAKYPGLFIMAADMNNVDYFSVTGSLGADGEGSKDTLVLEYTDSAGTIYKGFVTRTFDTGDATVNHLIITENHPDLSHSHDSTTHEENHIVSGLNENDRLYYLLFSTEENGYVDDETMQQIFSKFMNIVIAPYNAVEISDQLAPADSTTLEMMFNVSHFEEGTYEIPVVFSSNDPNHPADTIFVMLNAPGDACPEFDVAFGEGCNGQVSFTDNSLNTPDSWTWTFGDGTNSVNQNPVHFYDSPGEYSVSLEVCNDISCNTTTEIITVENTGGPIPAECIPSTTSEEPDYYISEVHFHDMSNSSSGSDFGYEDFTCEPAIQLNVGNTYDLTVELDPFHEMDVRAWIDYNGDGEFEENELVMFVIGVEDEIAGEVTIPEDVVLNQALRMRVLADLTHQNPCYDLDKGEAEDYSVIINPIIQIPVANFNAEAIDECEGEYQFNDLSTNEPTLWNWDFGDGNSATEQNPSHTYQSGGDYSVVLAASNVAGTDSHEVEISVPYQGLGNIEILNTPVVYEETLFEVEGEGIEYWEWDFGDGTTTISSEPNVTHVYTETGSYIVSVSTQSHVCVTDAETEIEIFPVHIEDVSSDKGNVVIFPNPTNSDFMLTHSQKFQIQSINIYNSVGKKVRFKVIEKEVDKMRISLENAAPGVYFILGYSSDGKIFREQLIIER